jgi:hypothetical protein
MGRMPIPQIHFSLNEARMRTIGPGIKGLAILKTLSPRSREGREEIQKPNRTASFSVSLRVLRDFAVKITFGFKRIENPLSGIVGITLPAWSHRQ